MQSYRFLFPRTPSLILEFPSPFSTVSRFFSLCVRSCDSGVSLRKGRDFLVARIRATGPSNEVKTRDLHSFFIGVCGVGHTCLGYPAKAIRPCFSPLVMWKECTQSKGGGLLYLGIRWLGENVWTSPKCRCLHAFRPTSYLMSTKKFIFPLRTNRKPNKIFLFGGRGKEERPWIGVWWKSLSWKQVQNGYFSG